MAGTNTTAWMRCCGIKTVVAAALVAATLGSSAVAHEGPPYPLLVDATVSGYLVSVWADPDMGTGTFYVLADNAATDVAASAAAAELRVEVWVQPVSERLPAVRYPAEKQQLRERVQFVAFPKFDRIERWKAGIVITPAGEPSTELITEVEVTPPGLGARDLAIYLFPMVLIGGLWAFALSRRWRESRALGAESPQDLCRVSERN